MDMQYQQLKIERVPTNQLGLDVGIIALKRPKALNALNDEMIAGLVEQLGQWAADDSIAMVVIRGIGDRAYCAGGDIKALHDDGHVRFLANEYRLDYALYHYPKPIVHFLHGFVMGGGMGLMASGALKICTSDCEFAMPENAIGFFPDVGYRYHLARIPHGLGAFIGLTGAQMTASFAQMLGLVDAVLPVAERQVLLSHFYDRVAQWRRQDGDILQWIKTWALELPNNETKPNNQQAVSPEDAITALVPKDILEWCQFYWNIAGFSWWQDLEKLVAKPSPCPELMIWPRAALSQLSPLSLAVTHIVLQRAQAQELEQVFNEDYWVAAQLYKNGDLKEGIIAKMLEKRPAQWRYTREDLTSELLAQFTPPNTFAKVLRQQIQWSPAQE